MFEVLDKLDLNNIIYVQVRNSYVDEVLIFQTFDGYLNMIKPQKDLMNVKKTLINH